MLALLLSLAAVLSVAPGTACACGKERWEVKVGSDLDAPKIVLSPVVDTTIFDLTSLPAPINPNIRKNTRYAPTELTVYRVRATMTLIRRERDDDYHIVISDNRGRTMIIESADPECATGSRFEAQIWQVRDTIDRHFGGEIRRKMTLNIPITVTGVGFFDKMHGQEGAASNGIELHPLLALTFDDRAAPPAEATLSRPASR